MDYKKIFNRFLMSFIMISFFLYITSYHHELLIYLNFIIYLIIFFEIIKNFTLKKLFIILFLYLITSLIFLQLYLIYFYDFYKFVHFIFAIVFFDVFSYIGGIFFGKKKILPSISPGKTYFGVFSGITFVLFFSLIYNEIFSIYHLYEIILLTILIVIFAFSGDILESYFKRKSNLKDSSNLLPGHGGFF